MQHGLPCTEPLWGWQRTMGSCQVAGLPGNDRYQVGMASWQAGKIVLLEDYDTLSDAERKEMVDDVVNEAGRSKKIISNLLDFARESGSQLEPLDLARLVGDTVKLTANELKVSGVISVISNIAPKAVSEPEPTICISPTSGEPGTAIRVMGKGWQARDSLAVLLEDPWSMTCEGGTVATTQATEEGELNALLMYPASGCWAGLARAQVAVRSLQTDRRAAAGFEVLAVAHTPTPTGLPPVTTEPSPTSEPTLTVPVAPVTITPTHIAVPTATPVPTTAPTATPTPMPSAMPTFAPLSTATSTATSTPTPLPAIVDWRGEYFDNVNLVGDARLVRNDKGPA